MTGQADVEQVMALLRDLAAAVEQQSARLVELTGRVDSIESGLVAVRATQVQTADRLERMAGEIDVRADLAALTSQVGALRAAQVEAGQRSEALAADLTKVSRVDASVGRLRDEMCAQIDTAQRALESEVTAVRQAQQRDVTELGREVHVLRQDAEAARRLPDRMTGLERRLADSDQTVAKAELRIEEVAAGRLELADMLKRSELHLIARLDGLGQRVDELATDVGEWRGRIDANVETVREARGVAESMRAEAERLATAHHATTEGQRLFEGRVQTALEGIRSELQSAWEHARQADERVSSGLADSNAEREREVAALHAAVDDLDRAIAALRRGMATDRDLHEEALRKLRADVGGALAALQESTAKASELVESGLPQGQRSADHTERREALRVALKARRGEPEG